MSGTETVKEAGETFLYASIYGDKKAQQLFKRPLEKIGEEFSTTSKEFHLHLKKCQQLQEHRCLSDETIDTVNRLLRFTEKMYPTVPFPPSADAMDYENEVDLAWDSLGLSVSDNVITVWKAVNDIVVYNVSTDQQLSKAISNFTHTLRQNKEIPKL
jgi:hypothetical protein